jgi:hypothetical protein
MQAPFFYTSVIQVLLNNYITLCTQKTEMPQLLCFSNYLVIGFQYVILLPIEFMSRKIHVHSQHADNERF